MTGPLALLFAQVRLGLHTLTDASFGEADDAAMHENSLNAYAALSSIERHVQDMENRAERAEGMIREHHRSLAAIGGGPCVCDICAALPAREKEEE